MKLIVLKIFHKIVDKAWNWCWFHLVSQRIRMNYKYVGYDFWWMKGTLDILEEEVDHKNYSDPQNMYKLGQIDAYEKVFEAMRQDCR